MSRDLDEIITKAKAQVEAMTPEEREAMLREQSASFTRGMGPCEHGILDWEDCPDCRRAALAKSKRDGGR